MLQSEDELSALRALKKLARDRPTAIDCPDDVLHAPTLEAALEAAFWRTTRDAHGDIVAIRYAKQSVRGLADEFPRELLATLSRQARQLAVEVVERADPNACTIYSLDGGRFTGTRCWRSRFILERTWAGLHGSPGDVVVVPIRVEPVEGAARDLTIDVRGPDCTIEYDRSPFAPGETREVRVTIGAKAIVRVPLTIVLASGDALQASVGFGIDVDGLEPRPAIKRAAWSTSGPIAFHRRMQRALLRDIQRFAARHRDEALTSALQPVVDNSGHIERLEIVSSSLPCDERRFRSLLAAIADRAHDGGALELVYAKRPDRVVAYKLSRSGLEVAVRATD